MKIQKRIRNIITGILMSVVMIDGILSINATEVSASSLKEANALELHTDGLYSIMGTTSCDIGQMINYYEANATYPSYYANSDAPTIYDFCRIYIEECATEGIRAEVAFCQAMKETGFLRFGGRVDISQYNFAGIGAKRELCSESGPQIVERHQIPFPVCGKV